MNAEKTYIYKAYWKESPAIIYMEGIIYSDRPLTDEEIEASVKNWEIADWDCYDWDTYVNSEVYDLEIVEVDDGGEHD